MSRKLLYFTVVVVIAVATGWNVSRNMNGKALSDVALANVEAPAGEDASGCSNYCTSDSTTYNCYVYYSNGAVLYCPNMKSKYA
jgi:hypothetical protein